MQTLEFRILVHENDIEQYLDRVEHYSGVRLPADYVMRSKIVGVFCHDKLAAGYMLVTAPAFRSLSFVPDRVKNTNKFFDENTHDMMEVNGLWIGPALRDPRQQITVWTHLIKDIFFSRKKYVLLLRNSKNANMKRFTDMAKPVSLYEGHPILMAGDQTHESIQVSFTTRWKIILNSHKYYREYRDRQKRATRFVTQKSSTMLSEKGNLEFS